MEEEGTILGDGDGDDDGSTVIVVGGIDTSHDMPVELIAIVAK